MTRTSMIKSAWEQVTFAVAPGHMLWNALPGSSEDELLVVTAESRVVFENDAKGAESC